MRKFTFLITLLLLGLHSLTSVAQVTIGDGAVTGNHIPIEPFYNFTYSQVIYLQEEIGGTMDIGHLIYTATLETTLEDSSDWTVYIGHTTKTQFDTAADWIDVADLTQVFTGTATIDEGIVHILLDTEFSYNGTDNLVIAVKENQDGYDSSSHDFYTTAVTNNRSLSYWSDSTNPDPTVPPAANTFQAFIANITLAPTPTCAWVTNLLAESITAYTADLSWTENGTATSWNIEYGAAGFTLGEGTTVVADASPYALTDLSSSTNYDFYVQADCGGSTSTWSGPYTFQTVVTCPAPSDLTANTLTNSADLGWTENGAATAWNIQYAETGFSIGDGTIVAVDANPYTLSGLLASTSYDYYVQAICGADDVSLWAGPFTFTTLCDVVTPYYHEDFITFVPMCWDEADNGDATTGPTDFGNGGWTNSAVMSSETARINLYSNSKSDWVLSPLFDLSTGGYEVVLDVAVTNWLSADPDVMGSDDAVMLLYTEDGTTWNTINTWTVADNLPNELTQFSFAISSIGTTVQFGILASEGAVNDTEDYDFHIDNFKVRIPPTCPEPSALIATNVFADTADITWTENGGATSWNIEYGPVGFTQGEGTLVVADVNPFTLTGLTSDTEYDYYVQADCGVDDQSVWIGTGYFHTMVSCPAPTELDAINVSENSADLNWNANGTTNWNIEYGPSGFVQGAGTTLVVDSNPYTLSGLLDSTSYDYYVQADCAVDDQSTWVGPYTFQTSIVGGTCGVYTIVLTDSYGDGWNGGYVDVFVNGVLYLGGITIATGTGPETSEIPVDIEDVISVVYTAGSYSSENEYIIYDQLGTEVVNEGAGGTTPGNTGDPSVPNGLAACPSCPAPIDLAIANLEANSVDFSWTEYGAATSWNIEYGAAGFTIGTGTSIMGTTDNPYALTGLVATQIYDVYVQAACGGGDVSLWSGPVTFQTPPTPTVNNDCSDATVIPIDGTFINTTNFASTASEELPLPGDMCGNIGGGEDVWYTVTATELSNITITTAAFAGSELDDTIMVAYSGACGTLEEITCNDDYLSGFSSVTVNGVQAGETVYIRVFSYYDEDGTPFASFQINATFVSAVGLQDAIIDGFSMYPNPVENTLNIKANISLDKISIYDMLGRELLISTPTSLETQLDMVSLPTGSYIVKVKAGNSIASYNLIKR